MTATLRSLLVLGLFAFLFPCALAIPTSIQSQDRVVATIDDSRTVVLAGNLNPLTRIATDLGELPQEQLLTELVLVLTPSVQQQQNLNALLDAQYNPQSPLFHAWLTSEQYGQQFGISNHDLDRIQNWLESHGLTVEEIPSSHTLILFRGTTTKVAETFGTSFHRYQFEGDMHIANATEISIPYALVGIVAGVSSLHDFRSAPMHNMAELHPEYSSGSLHYLAPADFATIYNLNPLYNSGTDGSEETIAIVARSNINLADVTAFRSSVGLPTNNPAVIVNGTNPGLVSVTEQGEATLDTEWAGAVAPKATVKLVVSASTATTDGVDLSAQYIVNNNLAPVMTTSYGSCESNMGAAENAFYNALWKQASVQGITVLVSSGDSGAAGCDASSASKATHPKGVNGLCSTPYSTCVGGTEFVEGTNPSLYWTSTTNPTTWGSALGYIPESAWNESGSVVGGSALWSTGGGASTLYAKPSWQSGPGVPNDKMRDVPDVSLNAAGHDGYIVEMNGGWYVFNGTSAASPSMAGVLALVAEKTGGRLGNVSPVLYALATAPTSTSTSAFHDITTGSNTVPGLTGYAAQNGYDLATGLGSVNASALANSWKTATTPPSFQLTTSATSFSVMSGSSTSFKLSVTPSNGFTGTVYISNSSLSGFTVRYQPANLSGTASSTVTITAATTVAAGSYTLAITGNSGTITKILSIPINVQVPPGLNVTASTSAISLSIGSSASLTITTQALGSYGASVTLSVSGLPAGVSAAFSPVLLPAPGNGSSKLTLRASQSPARWSGTITVKASGANLTSVIPITLQLLQAATKATSPH